jgi:hypothetical protein
MRTILFLVSLITAISHTACASSATPTANLPDPASVECAENGTLEIRAAADGSNLARASSPTAASVTNGRFQR